MPSGHGLSERLCQGERATDYSQAWHTEQCTFLFPLHNKPAMFVYTKWKTREDGDR